MTGLRLGDSAATYYDEQVRCQKEDRILDSFAVRLSLGQDANLLLISQFLDKQSTHHHSLHRHVITPNTPHLPSACHLILLKQPAEKQALRP